MLSCTRGGLSTRAAFRLPSSDSPLILCSNPAIASDGSALVPYFAAPSVQCLSTAHETVRHLLTMPALPTFLSFVRPPIAVTSLHPNPDSHCSILEHGHDADHLFGCRRSRCQSIIPFVRLLPITGLAHQIWILHHPNICILMSFIFLRCTMMGDGQRSSRARPPCHPHIRRHQGHPAQLPPAISMLFRLPAYRGA